MFIKIHSHLSRGQDLLSPKVTIGRISLSNNPSRIGLAADPQLQILKEVMHNNLGIDKVFIFLMVGFVEGEPRLSLCG